jgi:hypothetical protein
MNKSKEVLISILLPILFTFSCSSYMKKDEAKVEIQQYLDNHYNKLFKIDKIDKDYNPDMFHEQWGFKVWLTDENKTSFGPVFFEKNEYQHGWITYKGSDINKEYQKAIQLKR